MNILLFVIIGLIALGHIATALLDGFVSRILTCLTILLHPIALIPLLILKLPFEAVAILFLSSALFYLIVSIISSHLKSGGSPSDEGGGAV